MGCSVISDAGAGDRNGRLLFVSAPAQLFGAAVVFSCAPVNSRRLARRPRGQSS